MLPIYGIILFLIKPVRFFIIHIFPFYGTKNISANRKIKSLKIKKLFFFWKMCQNFLHILIYGKSVLNVLPICVAKKNRKISRKNCIRNEMKKVYFSISTKGMQQDLYWRSRRGEEINKVWTLFGLGTLRGARSN